MHGSSATLKTKSSHFRVARQRLPCGSSTTWFQTSHLNLVRQGSSTTFETGLRIDYNGVEGGEGINRCKNSFRILFLALRRDAASVIFLSP